MIGGTGRRNGGSRHDRSHGSDRAGRVRGGAGTGRAGRAGACLRARSRHGQAHARRGRRAGRGDLADPRSVRAALDGADALFLSCADDPRRVGWETSAIDAAVAAGVRRVVKLSAVGAEPGSPVAFWDWHGQVEQHLRASGTGWVILRSSWYMSNLLAAAAQVAAEGRLYAPAGQARVAMIDPRDVGAAAAALLSPARATRGGPTSSPAPRRSPSPRCPPDCPRPRAAGSSSPTSPAKPQSRP